MARYINPKVGSKEEFLRKYGLAVGSTSRPSFSNVPKGFELVCHVNNGFFTAAAVIEDEADLKAYLLPNDSRPKSFFYLKTEYLGGEVPDPMEANARMHEKGEWVDTY